MNTRTNWRRSRRTKEQTSLQLTIFVFCIHTASIKGIATNYRKMIKTDEGSRAGEKAQRLKYVGDEDDEDFEDNEAEKRSDLGVNAKE